MLIVHNPMGDVTKSITTGEGALKIWIEECILLDLAILSSSELLISIKEGFVGSDSELDNTTISRADACGKELQVEYIYNKEIFY